MPENNKITDRVFAHIAKTNKHEEAHKKFLAIDAELGIGESETLTDLKEMYTEIVNDFIDDIDLLAAIEEIIIQIRAKVFVNSELRLSLNREYIYARSTFYRRDKKINDIRVLMGKVDEYGDNLDELLRDPDFRLKCILKLVAAMDKLIDKNINKLISHTYEKIPN